MKAAAFLMSALALLVASSASGVDVQVYEDAIDLSRNTGHWGSITATAFSPDKKTLATAAYDDSILLWDVDDGRIRGQLTGPQGYVSALAYSPDGSELAAGDSDGTIQILDAETGALKATLEQHEKRIDSLAYSSDGKTLLSAGDGIMVWDAEKKELIKSIGERTITYRELTFSSDGSAIAGVLKADIFVNRTGAIELWDVDSGALKRRIDPTHIDNIRSLSFSSDSRTLAAAGFLGIRLWDVETGAPINALEEYSSVSVRKVHFLPDGKRIALFIGRSIYTLDLNTGERFLVMTSLMTSTSESISLDGERVALGFGDASVQIWNLNDRSLHAAFECDNTGPVCSAAFSRDGKTLAVGSYDGSVRLWDVPTLRFLHKLWQAPYSNHSIDFSKDGKTVLGANYTDVALWDVETGQFKRAFNVEPGNVEKYVAPAAYSPDGKTIASIRYVYRDTGVRDVIELQDADTGETIQQISIGGGFYSRGLMDYSPDGRTIALAGSLFYNVETGRLRATVTHHSIPDCFAYSPDGGAFAVGHRDGTITIWNAQTYKRIRTIQAHPVYNHAPRYIRYVEAVAYSPDGQTLASGGDDGLVRLWQTETGGLKAILKGHTRWVEALAYSPDGRYLVSGSYDGTLLLWNMRRGEQTPIQWADIRLPEEAPEDANAPAAPALLQNYPNPFNPETWIPFDLAETSAVRISIYNGAGEMIRKLDLGTMPAGYYRSRQKAAYWDGRNDLGERAASGIYFARIEAGSFTAVRRMFLLK